MSWYFTVSRTITILDVNACNSTINLVMTICGFAMYTCD